MSCVAVIGIIEYDLLNEGKLITGEYENSLNRGRQKIISDNWSTTSKYKRVILFQALDQSDSTLSPGLKLEVWIMFWKSICQINDLIKVKKTWQKQ